MVRLYPILMGVVICVACGSSGDGPVSATDGPGSRAPEPSAPVTPGPPTLAPPALAVRAPARVEAERLYSGSVLEIVALDDDRWLAQTDAGLVLGDGAAPQRFDDSGLLLEGAWSHGAEVLVLLDGGLYYLDGEGVRASPVSNILYDKRILGVAPSAEALWVGTDAGLHLWSEGRLHPVEGVEGLDGAIALSTSRSGSVFAATAAGVFQLRRDPLTAQLVFSAPGATHLGSDVEGGFWVVTGDGVYRRGRYGEETMAMEGVESLVVGSSVAWLIVEDRLWHGQAWSLRALNGAPKPRCLAVSSDDTALVGNSRGVYRVRVERGAHFEGLASTVEGPTTVAIVLNSTEGVSVVEAAVDDARLAVVDGPPWVVELSPEALGGGAHRLRARISYEDGSELELEQGFEVTDTLVPNWEEYVQPLFVEQCEVCHGERGYARKLHDRTVWMEQMDSILLALEEGRMPLPPNPPLIERDINRLRRWAEAGYPEAP